MLVFHPSERNVIVNWWCAEASDGHIVNFPNGQGCARVRHTYRAYFSRMILGPDAVVRPPAYSGHSVRSPMCGLSKMRWARARASELCLCANILCTQHSLRSTSTSEQLFAKAGRQKKKEMRARSCGGDNSDSRKVKTRFWLGFCRVAYTQ